LSAPVSGSYGGVAFPLPDRTTAQSLLPVADPPIDELSRFLPFFISKDLANAMTGALSGAAPAVTSNIAGVYTTDPGVETVKPEQLKFPAFFIWRKSGTYGDRVLEQPHGVSTCGWGYIMPAMTFEQAEKYSHVLYAVERSMGRALSFGYHPAYNGGLRISAGISSMRLLSANHEIHPAGELSSFYCVMGDFELVGDAIENLEDFPPFDGTDYDVGVGNATEILPGVVQADDSVPIEEG
jgi:hypothetical protein